jgi:hypothetical protein
MLGESVLKIQVFFYSGTPSLGGKGRICPAERKLPRSQDFHRLDSPLNVTFSQPVVTAVQRMRGCRILEVLRAFTEHAWTFTPSACTQDLIGCDKGNTRLL